ncbi:hypothetical protein [Viridibacillus sp. FSL H8-0123]|uniref:hypothetical protein n=1 Tax=Viridibacillus sp. FSL H8-0123 TaxID=1928922 RepID=UPI00096BD8AF|nr:hypothetical protein [Viridibacillus sp. FSL H8-0123]OMC79201.1 hypothetical protein BK130_18610 [Viridibacillus sp. FSL H8-0123]
MSSKTNIQKQFYNIYKGQISISEFEEWLYKTQEIESVYGNDFYFNLLDLDYRKKHIKNELQKLIETKIPFNEFEQTRIISLLENIKYEKGDIVEILEQLYDDYCNGYSFLRYLGLTYITGIDALPKLQQKDEWDKSEFDSKREILNSIKPKIINEALRLLSFFQKGLIKIIEKSDYSDYRKEEEKIELNDIERMYKE